MLDPAKGADAVFFDAKPSFEWHPGLLLDGATVQAPFLSRIPDSAPTAPPRS
ncbi:MAG: SidA/IucD/PvdA family monooxygenase [Egibacteraceae bacterium]